MGPCQCAHGSDRHFVDYTYGHGTWLGRCLDCNCILYRPVSRQIVYGQNTAAGGLNSGTVTPNVWSCQGHEVKGPGA